MNITGLGLCTSLGPDVEQSCAAARAGLSRAAPIEHFWVSDEAGVAETEAVGHAASPFTAGFSGSGRLARIGAIALEDLLESVELTNGDHRETAIVLNQGTGYYLAAAAREAIGLRLHDLVLPRDLKLIDESLTPRETVLSRILELCDLEIPSKRQETIFEDQAGVGNALLIAQDLLQQGEVRRCVIGGVDSYVDAPMLEALSALNLLKGPAQPLGFIPGEAAAFVLLESGDQAECTSSSVLARVTSVAIARDDTPSASGTPASGLALAEVIRRAIGSSSVPAGAYGWVLGSLNGTSRAAAEWGSAVPRLEPGTATAMQWAPAASFGEVGAALGFTSLCVIARAFTRGYANTGNVLMWLSSPSGTKAAVCVQEP